jgi:GR25 family glycosyltransferase involved in LPS biosynthesis
MQESGVSLQFNTDYFMMEKQMKLYNGELQTIEDNIWMIQIPDNGVSDYYKKLSLPTWEKFGYEINMFDAVTPDTLNNYNYLEFGKYYDFREFTDTEKAGFYSHVELWKKCIDMNEPITIIEHDVECLSEEIPIISELFAFATFQNDDAWENYCGHRFRGHPFWGEGFKICPPTHAYYMTPHYAELLLDIVTSRPQYSFVDDILFIAMGKDETYITEHATPIYDIHVGGTMTHE